MKITEADVSKFQTIYKKHTGKSIKRNSAYAKLGLLVRQMELIYQPIRQEQAALLNEYEDEQQTQQQTKDR